MDELCGPAVGGPVAIIAVDAGPEGDEFRDHFRAGTARTHGTATLRVHRDA